MVNNGAVMGMMGHDGYDEAVMGILGHDGHGVRDDLSCCVDDMTTMTSIPTKRPGSSTYVAVVPCSTTHVCRTTPHCTLHLSAEPYIGGVGMQ